MTTAETTTPPRNTRMTREIALNFAQLDFRTQAQLPLMPLVRWGIDIRKTHFAVAVPQAMLETAIKEEGLVFPADCGHEAATAGTDNGVCLICHALYCVGMGDDDEQSLFDTELEEQEDIASLLDSNEKQNAHLNESSP